MSLNSMGVAGWRDKSGGEVGDYKQTTDIAHFFRFQIQDDSQTS